MEYTDLNRGGGGTALSVGEERDSPTAYEEKP